MYLYTNQSTICASNYIVEEQMSPPDIFHTPKKGGHYKPKLPRNYKGWKTTKILLLASSVSVPYVVLSVYLFVNGFELFAIILMIVLLSLYLLYFIFRKYIY